ncbi:carboxylesterase family protein [Clostridium sp. E02]|uniref:carboxylesterase/lipase family protein n=1 Tax=Clostridium sp. E02 TaxID=2487134 RepID=UPI000F5236CB|nr:carboxylesterase family protein [Clostridium sp. E02]
MIRIAKTENGIVRGIEAADPRITAFKGIPFAAPPVGEKRWRAPEPCENWEGVRDCFRFGPISMQGVPGLGDNIYDREWHVDPDIAMSEDCLYLNVWTGAKKVGEKRPVLVWYFGGGLQNGYTAEMEFDGERLARRGIIVVSVNYRVNVFGFLSHPKLTNKQPDDPANFGHLDQLAGLKWVTRNIEAFGGDPENITIAGQSAGGGSVMTQLTTPRSEGLFQKAIVLSGVLNLPYDDKMDLFSHTLADAEKTGEEFFEFIGVKDLDQARAMDGKLLYEKYEEFGGFMGTVIDEKFCFGNSYQRFMENKRAMVPIMAGNTADEFFDSIYAGSDEELKEKVKTLYPGQEEEFLRLLGDSPRDSEGNAGSVSSIEFAVRGLFHQNSQQNNPVSCYYYTFDADIPGWDNPGNFHSVDLWFFFETLAKCWRPLKGNHYDLARHMANYWANFMKTGDPNGNDADGEPMPEWQPFTEENPNGILLSTEKIEMNQQKEPELMTFLLNRLKEKFEE